MGGGEIRPAPLPPPLPSTWLFLGGCRQEGSGSWAWKQTVPGQEASPGKWGATRPAPLLEVSALHSHLVSSDHRLRQIFPRARLTLPLFYSALSPPSGALRGCLALLSLPAPVQGCPASGAVCWGHSLL